MDWPAISEPLLRERLAMEHAAFADFLEQILRSLPLRRLTPEALANALGYPWERPRRSYLLAGETVTLLDDLGIERRASLIEGSRRGPDGTARHPLLAIGSNGAPATLSRKLAHLPGEEREVLVLAGELRDFDVGAAARPTAYGSMPATLFESPGTAVRAAVLWVSDAQVTQLCWTEIGYRLGRLDRIVFMPDQPVEPIGSIFAYAARWGTFCPDGEPVALAAIPAAGRRAPALSQRQLLDRAARLGLGECASAETLVREIFEDTSAFVDGAGPRIARAGRSFAPAGWTAWTPERP